MYRKKSDGELYFMLGMVTILVLGAFGAGWWLAPKLMLGMVAFGVCAYIVGRIIYRLDEGKWKW